MPVDERYRRQVDLLVRTLPHVAQEKCFALKGGTAINLFVRNLPRLSVDIDLTYLPVAGRARSLAAPCRRPRVSGGNANGHRSRTAGTIPCDPAASVATFACERNLLSGHQVVLVDRTPAIRTRSTPGLSQSTKRLQKYSAAHVVADPYLGAYRARLSPTRRLRGRDASSVDRAFRPAAGSARVQPVTCNELPGENVVPARSDLGRRAAGNSLHPSNRDSCAMLDSAPISLTRAVREARRESSPSQAGPPWRC